MRSTVIASAIAAVMLGIAAHHLGTRRSGEHASSVVSGGTFESARALEQAAFADIEALDELATAYRPATDFWLHDAGAEARRIERILAAERAARAALIERFGVQITATPVLLKLFKPLHDRLPQLSTDEQVLIYELERQFLARAHSVGDVQPFEELLTLVRARLGADIANEYALRVSPLADQLRRAAAELSEFEFRRAFAELSALSAASRPQEFLAARRKLREILGARRFAALWALRDPRFARIEAAAKRFDLSAETTLSAWALLLKNQEAMLAAVADSDTATRQDRVREHYETGRRRLQELIGARAAEAILQANAAPQSADPAQSR